MTIDKKKAASILSDPTPLPPIPPAPWVERDDSGRVVSFTANGLEAIRLWACRGRTQGAIAAELQITSKRFEALLGKADTDEPTPARLSYESGFAQHKSSLIEKLTERALRGDSICGMFVLKAVHQLRDSGNAIEINNGPRINFTLPLPMSEEAYLNSLGITEVHDARDPKTRREQNAAMGRPQLEHQPTGEN